MRRRAIGMCFALAAAVLVAGCGGQKHAAPPATTAATTTAATTTAGPTLTSPAEIAACAELGRNLQIVTTMTTNATQYLTNSLHPKQLAQRIVVAQQTVLYGAKAIGLLDVTPSLEAPRNQFVAGLRRYGRDFAKAKKAVDKNDLQGAANAMADPVAQQQVANATKKLTADCRGSSS